MNFKGFGRKGSGPGITEVQSRHIPGRSGGNMS
jgi:hypothetical protein